MSKNFESIFKEFADSETFVLSRGLLEDYKRQAAQDERERIIKLLETKVLKNVSPNIHSLELLHNQLVNNCIALIKGENK